MNRDLNPPEWADADSWWAGVAASMEFVEAFADEYGTLAETQTDAQTETQTQAPDVGDDCPDCGSTLVGAMGRKEPVCPACGVE